MFETFLIILSMVIIFCTCIIVGFENFLNDEDDQ